MAESQNVPQLAIHDIFGVLGITFNLTWGLCVLRSPLLFKTLGLTMLPIVAKEVFIAAQLLIVVIILLLVSLKLFVRLTVYLLIVVAACSPLAAILDIVGAGPATILVFWAISGFGTTVILVFWGSYITKLDHRRIVLYPTLSFVFMGLLMMMVGLFDPATAAVVITLFPLISLLMLYLERRMRSSERSASIHEEFVNSGYKPFPRNGALIRSILGTMKNSLFFGFAIYYFFIMTSHNASLVFGLMILIACIVRVIDLSNKDIINMDSLGRSLMLVAAITLLPLSFINADITFYLCCIILIYSGLANMTGMSAIGENARTNEINPLIIFSVDRLGNLTGLGIGILLSFLSFGTEGLEAATGSFFPCVLMIILVLMHPIIVSGNHSYQFTVSRKTNNIAAPNTESHYGFWRYRCMKFAEHYRLSPRQLEVMLLLAKGRDAVYIEETLMISGHTAKAHIYNIYSKTNVHSRQELITLIESFEVPDQDG